MTNIKLDGYFLEGVKGIRVSCEHYYICKNAAECIKKTNELK